MEETHLIKHADNYECNKEVGGRQTRARLLFVNDAFWRQNYL